MRVESEKSRTRSDFIFLKFLVFFSNFHGKIKWYHQRIVFFTQDFTFNFMYMAFFLKVFKIPISFPFFIRNSSANKTASVFP